MALQMMPIDPSNVQSRYLAIGYLPSEVSLSFEPRHELTLSSKRRAKEARQCVLSLLKRRRVRSWKEDDGIRASIPHQGVEPDRPALQGRHGPSGQGCVW